MSTREGDEYVINGQKIWTSTTHHADWIFVLPRTSPAAKKQEGISFILADLKTPGVEVRPILSIDGHHYTNEVFFTNVRVPAANLVGQENRGWDYAKFLLGNERVGIARVGLSKARLREAKMLATRQITRTGWLWTDRDFGQQFARVEIELELKAVEVTAMRLLDSDKHREKGKLASRKAGCGKPACPV